MSNLVARLGAEAAAAVIAAAGGARLSIPPTLDNCRQLEATVGRELAVLLVLHFGGNLIYVPHAARSRQVSTAEVARLTLEHKSARMIARELRCSDRTVYGQRAKAREAGLLPARP